MTTNTFKELCFKDKVSYILCIIAFVFGMVLTTIGIFLPPAGEISGSVISVIGMFLSWSGGVIGISMHYRNEFEKIKSDIYSGKKEDDK